MPVRAAAAVLAEMRNGVSAFALAALLTLVGTGLSVLPAVPVAGQSPPERIMTDTPEYCLHLLDLVSRRAQVKPDPVPPEVTDLSSEGRRMCDEGQVRAGILRLRRALVMMDVQRGGP